VLNGLRVVTRVLHSLCRRQIYDRIKRSIDVISRSEAASETLSGLRMDAVARRWFDSCTGDRLA
jgi:hypothetical protein